MKKILTLWTLLILGVFSFLVLGPSSVVKAQAEFTCIFSITSPGDDTATPQIEVANDGGFIVTTSGETPFALIVVISNVSGSIPIPDTTNSVTILTKNLGLSNTTETLEVRLDTPGEGSPGCTYQSATGPFVVNLSIGSAPDTSKAVFTAPDVEVNHGFMTLDLIQVKGLPPGDTEYKFQLSGRWDGNRLREKGKDDKFKADLVGTISVTSICDNGEALRNDCEDTFKAGPYKLDMVLASNESVVIATHVFEVKVILSEVVGEEKIIDLDADEIVTPFGVIKGTPEGLAQAFLSLGVSGAGGFAFLLMVFGAYRLIFAGGNPESIQEGRQMMTAAIVGLIVVVLAVFLLDLIGISILGLDIL